MTAAGCPPERPDRIVVSTRVRLDDPEGPGPAREAPAAISIAGPTIAAVQPLPDDAARRREAVARLAAGARIDDVGARPVTPAFVNAHTHLALAFLRGPRIAAAARGNVVEDLFFRLESRLAPGDVRAFVRMGAYESLLSGVGLVWDHYYFGEAVADGLADAGLAGVVAPTLQDLAGPGVGAAEDALAATEAIAGDPARRAAGVHAALGPHATDTVSAGLWEAALDLAGRHALPVHAHLAQSAEEVARVRAREGSEPLPWLARVGVLDRAPTLVLAHALYVREAQLRALDPARHALVFCPSAQAVFGFPAPVRRWAAAGVPFVVATDSAAGNDSMSLQKELRLVAAARTADVAAGGAFEAHWSGPDGAPTEEAVRAHRDGRVAAPEADALAAPAALLDRVWAAPGALHPGLSAGRVAPGHLANLVAWDDGHPALWPGDDLDRALAYGDTTGALHALWVAGRPVGEPGDVAGAVRRSAAYREARAEADGRLRALLARA